MEWSNWDFDARIDFRRRIRWSRLLLAVFTSVVAAAAGLSIATSGMTPPSPWRPLGTFEPGVALTPEASVCGAAVHCVGADDGLLGLANEDRVGYRDLWYGDATPASLVACPTPRICVSVGGQSYLTTKRNVAYLSRNAGRSWTSLDMPVAVRSIMGVACPTSKVCVGVAIRKDTYRGRVIIGPPQNSGSVVVRSTNSGVTWRVVYRSPGAELYGLRCTTTEICIAVGGDDPILGGGVNAFSLVSTTAGLRWQRTSLPEMTPTFTSVDCWAPLSCDALSEQWAESTGSIETTSDGGRSWRMLEHLRASSDGDISCPNRRLCVAIVSDWAVPPGQNPLAMEVRTSDGGMTWHTTLLVRRGQPTGARDVKCTGNGFCTTSDGSHTWTSVDAGANWVRGAALQDVTPLQLGFAACSRTHCVAAGDGSTFVRQGRFLWRMTRTLYDPSGLSCAGDLCRMVGDGSLGRVLTSIDGGEDWHRTSVSGVTLANVQCASDGRCAAVGTNEAHASVLVYWATSTSASLLWHLPRDVGSLHDADCWRSGCAVVGRTSGGEPAVWVSRSPTSKWGLAWLEPQGGAMNTISCDASGSCVAGGYLGPAPAAVNAQVVRTNQQDGDRFNWPTQRTDDRAIIVGGSAGGPWGAKTAPPHVGAIERLACSTNSTCLGLGDSSQSGLVINALGVEGTRVLPFATVDGGASWATLFGDSGYLSNDAQSFDDVSCEQDGLCVLLFTDDQGGAVETRYVFPPDGPPAMI